MQYLKRVLRNKYYMLKLKYRIHQHNIYRKSYNSFSFDYKTKMANIWLKRYPEQAHFDLLPIKYWLENIVTRPTSVLEIGGWRGDLAEIVLSSYDHIIQWHNYDLIMHNKYQKCLDVRYKLITLNDYLWHLILKDNYNALIASHMIEHINWKEFTELSSWIPQCIETVLFEAPLPASAENINWKGDFSSHVLEKGWEQVIAEMKNHGFSVIYSENNTFVFKR